MKNQHAKAKTAISPTRSENYPQWYQEVIKAADLAENSVVRGCMVIKPWGYALWENIQQCLDKMLKATGHKNIYCPLFIPLSFLEKEAQHVAGFAKECAVVTHHKLEADANGKLHPTSPLEEPLIIRPTSEAIIGNLFSKWIQSYRDLPILINQWANVVRWEMRTRLFLRTSEFLWQEGHTAHATKEEAIAEAVKMLDVYVELLEKYLAIPVIKGEKTSSERFPGAVNTYCMEAMMQDKKALQAGTSHFLGQNFAKAFNIKFVNEEKQQEYAWTTSWGVTTRLIGSLIMTHSDDDGLILPPYIAPLQIIIVPLTHNSDQISAILQYCEKIANNLKTITLKNGQNIKVEIDTKEARTGDKLWGWIKKGVPIRIEIGQKELQQQTVFMARRDRLITEKVSLSYEEFVNKVQNYLEQIQENLLQQARKFQADNTKYITSKQDFYDFFAGNDENNGGFAIAPWIGDSITEQQIKNDLKVTARCVPLESQSQYGKGKCIFTGQQEASYVVFAKAY